MGHNPASTFTLSIPVHKCIYMYVHCDQISLMRLECGQNRNGAGSDETRKHTGWFCAHDEEQNARVYLCIYPCDICASLSEKWVTIFTVMRVKSQEHYCWEIYNSNSVITNKHFLLYDLLYSMHCINIKFPALF